MFFLKELKLLYTAIVLLLNLGFFINTEAMELKRSSRMVLQNADDYRLLEICTIRSQQKLSGVSRNTTRHHKKGHRRRSTTTSSTQASTIVNVDDSLGSYSDSNPIKFTTFPTLPKPLRLTAMLDQNNEDILTSKNYLHKEVGLQVKYHSDYHDGINKEVVPEVDESSLSKFTNRVKKMYRNSAAYTTNKLGGKSGRAGIFVTNNCTVVTAQIGTTAILHCEVTDITENTVTWIRRRDYSLLSVGLVTYSADNRYFSAHGRHMRDWALHVRFVSTADGGYYECQVPTHPPTSIFFKLVLVAAYADISGEPEKIIQEGSTLQLICNIRKMTEPPSYVFWYFEDTMVNYDIEGVTVTHGRQATELIIGKAEPKHSGNYTCVPANARASSVTVHVVQSEKPAAMQHGNSSTPRAAQEHAFYVLLIVLISLGLIINHCFQEIG